MAVSFLASCTSRDFTTISGETMGTYYKVQCQCEREVSKSEIEGALESISSVFSTWQSDSEISRFNVATHNRRIGVSQEFFDLVKISQSVSELSGGSFDVTISPLVNAWGFGSEEVRGIPSEEEIHVLLEQVGWQNLELREQPSSLLKLKPLSVDLSGIAKGYAVDQVADLLENLDCENYLVDIGGEIRVKGQNRFSNPWQIGVEVPDGSGAVLDGLQLTDIGVASSGDYQNFREIEGVRYSHVIDPLTGYPVNHNLVAVTVLDSSAAYADALATALLALGFEKGSALAEREALPVLFITKRDEKDSYKVVPSSAMEPYLASG